MSEIVDPLLPANPRVEFLVKHRADLDSWTLMPFFFALMVAPLYDHRPNDQQVLIGISVLAANWLWSRFSKRWVEGRVGVFRPRASSSLQALNKRPRRLTGQAWAALVVVVAVSTYLHHGEHTFYRPDGWMERAAGTWLCMSIVACLSRFLDRSNLRQRRLWYGIAAAVLAFAFSFAGTHWYATVLVLLGATGTVLGLLDLGLLLYFARTPAVVIPSVVITDAND
jgi:hypothetical protein